MATTTLYYDGDNSQLRNVIFQTTPEAIEQTKSIARQFQGKTELETCRNIFNFLKNKINYKADGFHQKVKLPSALLRERVGDCKSYSVFTYAILTNLGIPCQYVLVSYNQDPTPSHIYVKTDSGIIIDAVWGKFNSEKTPTHKFYKKVNDMRISRIAGIDSPQIGCTSCNTKMGAVQGNANQWYDDNKNTLNLNWKDKGKNYANKVTFAPIRGLFRKFIENNGGGIATSIFYKVYLSKPIEKTIPTQLVTDLGNSIKASAIAKGVKYPSNYQRTQIGQLSSVQTDSSVFNSGALTLPTNFSPQQAQMSLPDAWDKVMGKGQYNLYKTYVEKAYSDAYAKLKSQYTIPASKQSDIKNWKEVLKKWYTIGGNPYELYESIMEGKTKSPRGKDANYMLMVSKKRGLKAKDIGLIIRGFVSAFGGERFSWGQKDTYMFGSNKGIGEPITASTIATYIGIATSIFALLSKIWSWVEVEKNKNKAEEEMEKLETDGYVLEQDYLSMPLPRPKVIELKQVSVPNADAPNLEDVGSVIDSVTNIFGGSGGSVEELDKKQQEGALDEQTSQVVQEAKSDVGTKEYLELATKVTKAIPNTGETIVRYVKLDTSTLQKDPTLEAGFGQMALPILIGVGVIMALNSKNKIVK